MTSAGPQEYSHERRTLDRRETDESLREERDTTDQLLETDARARVGELVQERRGEAQRRLRDAREQADANLEKRVEVLPEVFEQLEEVADSLTKAAASLTGVAGTLKESFSSGAHTAPPATENADRPQAAHLMTNMAHVAQQLKATAHASAESAAGDGAHAETSGKLAEQLAEIAEGMADVSATLAEERLDVDVVLTKERRVTDRIIVQELEHVKDALAAELRDERHDLEEQRQATNEDLVKERRHTDAAVDHVLGLLAVELVGHTVAERRFATRNEFLQIVSHDLRGPLMTISGLATLVEQHAGGDDADRIRGWVEGVRRAAALMERLIRDLLDLGSSQDGQLRVVAQPLDIRDPIQNAIDAFQAVAAAKVISLEAELPAEPVIAICDDHRVVQVLSNLVHNAIKFTPNGGTIRIRAARRGSDCLVSVSDTGIGIPKTELRSIFERFRQLDGTDRTGLGLGLYISLWIVEAHGGRIWAESAVGAGTTFHFTLPGA